MNVHQGTAAVWSERDLTPANAPGNFALLDSWSGSISAGQWIEFDVGSAIRGAGLVNFIVSSGAAGDAVAFSSREGDVAPELTIIGPAAAFAGDFHGDQTVDGFDFLKWQRGVAGASDLALWEDRFGSSAPEVVPASVAEYGALPDDATFDTTAIQEAINSHASVFFPSGEYWLNAKLATPEGRRLLGPSSGPPAVLRIRHDPGTVSGDFALEVRGNSVTIQDLVIDKDFVDGSYGVGIQAENVSQLFISGVEIRDYSARYGIHLIESNNFEIRDVSIHDFLMNDRNAQGIGADMIQDSPAGIRITRSTIGDVSDSRIHDIEVGPLGRASISELVPSYGPQGYQADGITLSDSSGVVVERNNIWNSGELIDVLVSDTSVVRDNVLQMAYLFGVKTIGSQNNQILANYIADAAIGLWMGDHSTGGQATGNLIAENNFVNNGSRGIWNQTASLRMPFAVSGIYIDNDADQNTVVDNDLYDFHGYLSQFIRQGSGANVVARNQGSRLEFGPAGGEDIELIGEWTVGSSRPKELIHLNRALVLLAFAESATNDVTATNATYGGRAMTKISERVAVGSQKRVTLSAWLLTQDAVNAAAAGDFFVAWSSPPDSAAFASAFLANVDQAAPVAAEDTGVADAGGTLVTSPRLVPTGGIALLGGVASQAGEFSPLNGFTEALEFNLSAADAMAGHKLGVGVEETAAAMHTGPDAGAIGMIALRRNRAVDAATLRRIDVTTLGAVPNDGLNDAVRIQQALDNPAYDEVYLPRGTYHFDRSVFVRSGKSIRGNLASDTRILTLADITPFRIDNNTTDVRISNLTIERPQTANSNNEIIRGDNSSRVTIDNVQILNSPSRAPIIQLIGGSGNVVKNSTIVNYQVLRSEPSPERPGNHTQVFGSGVTLVNNANFRVVNNQVRQTTVLDFGTPVIKGVYQASAIQIVNSVDGVVQENTIVRTGQGIDTTGSAQLLVSDNVIEQCHSAGIKLVNGGNRITVEDNYIALCGLTGVWLSVGVAGLGGSYDNIVRRNTLASIGKGMGLDFWNGNFAGSTPAAIHLQAAQRKSDRVRNNLIADNVAYDNDELVGMIVSEPSNAGSPLPAINNTLSNNSQRLGAPPPRPFA